MTTTRPDAHPIANVDAITADRCGRYAGGSHSTLCDSQVTHAPSSLSPIPSRLTGCGRNWIEPAAGANVSCDAAIRTASGISEVDDGGVMDEGVSDKSGGSGGGGNGNSDNDEDDDEDHDDGQLLSVKVPTSV